MKSGHLRVLAVSTAHRLPRLPELPTVIRIERWARVVKAAGVRLEYPTVFAEQLLRTNPREVF